MTDYMDGFLDKSGHPIFRVGVFGVAAQFTQEMDALLDTGFSGFLSLPLAHALRAGLVLASTATYTLADGSTDHTLLCAGSVTMDGQKVDGLIALSKSNEALLGVEFLKKTGKTLHFDCSRGVVRLEKPRRDA